MQEPSPPDQVASIACALLPDGRYRMEISAADPGDLWKCLKELELNIIQQVMQARQRAAQQRIQVVPAGSGMPNGIKLG